MIRQPKKSLFSILFLDDEEQSVKYFKKVFGQHFNVIATTNPDEIWKIMSDRSGEIAVVISDQRMPKASGVDILTEIRERNYNIIRILTTAYSNLEDNIEAINKSNVFAYLSKPWNFEEVCAILHRALNEFETRQNYLSLSGSIAHEMRNPLNNIRQSTTLAKEKLLSAYSAEKFEEVQKKIISLTEQDFNEVVTSLDIACSSAKRGDVIINVILDSIRQKPVDVRSFKNVPAFDFLNSMMAEYSFKPTEKERVTIKASAKQDFTINCNEILLSYVFFNLLKNSLYYIKNFPNLAIEIKTEIGKDGFNRIYFRDSGPGIPPHKIENIFEAFSTSGKEDGTGLGLAFCRRTMKNMNGNISCNSEEGKFTEFVLSFPKAAKKYSKETSNRILLVDDQKTVLLINKKLLEKHLKLVRCDLAENGAEAIEQAKQNDYDLILMDIEMPMIDGITAIRKIREFDRQTPIVIHSTQPFEFITSALEKAEFDDYVEKQNRPNLLIKSVSKWSMIGLSKSLIKQDLVEEVLRDKNILLADDEEVNLILTSKYLKKYQAKVDEVKDGEDALDMIKKNKYDLILMDIEMPGVDGITATKKIREMERINKTNRVPMIAITGENTKEKIYEVLSAGFDDYFIKGGDYKELSETIAFWSSRPR